ncbi:MAG: hypothetical protein ABS95_02175 [Verrucomicrobia bacterium SCN 57-15]|nr:MAG: hypothetical protein ABS95_02175 [Verrucomicrobia bacterium SCN 57-15]
MDCAGCPPALAAPVKTYEQNRALRHNKPRSKPSVDAPNSHRKLQTPFRFCRHPNPELHPPKTPLVVECVARSLHAGKSQPNERT